MAEPLEKGFITWQRKTAGKQPGRTAKTPKTPQKLICFLCDSEIRDATQKGFGEHLRNRHAETLEKTAPNEKGGESEEVWDVKLAELFDTCVKHTASLSMTEEPVSSNGKDSTQASGGKAAGGDSVGVLQSPSRGRETALSPASSLKREGSRSPSPPKRSKARPTTHTHAHTHIHAQTASSAATPDADPGFEKRPAVKGTLWSADSQPQRHRPVDRANIAAAHRARLATNLPPRSPRAGQPPPGGGGGSGGGGAGGAYGLPSEDTTSGLIKQPETRPISQEQLVAEVKGIYAGLVMVESKCIEVDNAQNAQTDVVGNKLNNEQWQALIALHRTLLHEHHDFFLASQHPSASPALRRLASKYAMPARMWRHGIHSFLELLRHRLPASLEHMLTFIYLAYSMMALLYETVPAFEETWIECLGDLGRYRMAIEDDDIRHREVWTAVSRHWYSKASDKAPTTGRLYHHLAILARPNALQQLFYYTKSLCVPIHFDSARESIMTLLDPIMALGPKQTSRLAPTELEFVRCHGILFSKKYPEKFEDSVNEFINTLDTHIARNTRKFLEPGYYMGIAACCSMCSYGNEKDGIIYNAIKNHRTEVPVDQPMAESGQPEEIPKQLIDAIALANRTHNVILRRFGDTNILPYIHVTLVFMHHLTNLPAAMDLVGAEFPWKLASQMLNTLLDSCKKETLPRIEREAFPEDTVAKGENRRPLPEDYAMRGLLWVDRYHPNDWFANDRTDDDEKYMEVASMFEERRERVLYLGCRIAASQGGGKYLRYDSEIHRFSVPSEYDIDLDALSTTKEETVVTEDLGELPDAAPEAVSTH